MDPSSRTASGIRRQIAALALAAALCACGEPPLGAVGDPERGALLLRQFGCVTCHVIPGVPGGNGQVGPPLENIAERVYLGGVLPNTPENMVQWIRAPQRFELGTAMPDLAVSEANARDMVAYLMAHAN